MFSSLLLLFVVVTGALATWRTHVVFGQPSGLACALALAGLAAFAPLGSLVALLTGVGILGMARAEERKRIAG